MDNYLLQKEKSVAKVEEAAAKMMDDQNQLDFLNKLAGQFTVMAPEQGMVIYKRDWRGQKQGVGAKHGTVGSRRGKITRLEQDGVQNVYQ
ncbi:MAG: hypothetical protein U5K79_18370 [Cyclobacteriaceae bacterium]|nr:hypothetical protein [Cyclobacteriaceae bacterium]